MISFFFVEAFGGAAFGVGAGAGAVAEPADGDQVERAVCFAVAAAIEPVSGGAPGGGGDRAGAAEAGEGGLVAESFDVLAGADEERLISVMLCLPSFPEQGRHRPGRADTTVTRHLLRAGSYQVTPPGPAAQRD